MIRKQHTWESELDRKSDSTATGNWQQEVKVRISSQPVYETNCTSKVYFLFIGHFHVNLKHTYTAAAGLTEGMKNSRNGKIVIMYIMNIWTSMHNKSLRGWGANYLLLPKCESLKFIFTSHFILIHTVCSRSLVFHFSIGYSYCQTILEILQMLILPS